MSEPNIADDAVDRLRRLADFIPDLEERNFDVGRWVGGDRNADGSITMPYFEMSDRAREIVANLPVVAGFHWPAWVQTPRAKELVTNHDRIANATLPELVRLTTAIVRSDRFTEGSIAGAFQSGLILAIARRAAAIASR